MHPALEKLIQEERARADAKVDRALIELGLFEERKVYPTDVLSPDEAAARGFDQSEVIGGVRTFYRVEKVPIELTDEERAAALELCKSRERAAQQAEPPAKRKFALSGTVSAGADAREPDVIGKALAVCAALIWFVGAYYAFVCLLEGEVMGAILYAAIFFAAGMTFISRRKMIQAMDEIAEHTRGQSIRLEQEED